MSELAFQHALARFLYDPAARQAFLEDGDAPPAPEVDSREHGSVPPEVRARLRALDRRRTSIFSQYLLVNRLTKIVEALPYTSQTIGPRLWPLAVEYNQQFPPRHPKKFDEAMTFVGFAKPLFDTSRLGPPWLGDLLLYESSILELRFMRVTPSIPESRWLESHGDHLDRVYPRRSDTASLRVFSYDIEQIIDAFEQSQPVPELKPRLMLMLLQVMPDGTVRQDEVSPAIGELFDLCTGERNLACVISLLADRFGLSNNPEQIRAGSIEACAKLARRGILILE